MRFLHDRTGNLSTESNICLVHNNEVNEVRITEDSLRLDVRTNQSATQVVLLKQ